MTFPSFSLNGLILTAEILERIATEELAHQSPKDFGLNRPEQLRDEISSAWGVARSCWLTFRQKRENFSSEKPGTTETRSQWLIPVLSKMGYEISKETAEIIDQKSYAISHRIANRAQAPLHLVGFGNSLDDRIEHGARLSPHSLMQDYLNRSPHLYGVISNGRYLRLLRDSTRLVNLAYVEINLEKMMEDELFADFALLFRLLHLTRWPMTAEDGDDSVLEKYHQESLNAGNRIREKLSEAVEEVIRLLGDGFLSHPANMQLHQRFEEKFISGKEYYNRLLRLVYRFLFMIVTEERKLVFPDDLPPELETGRNAWLNYYSMDRLRRLAGKLYSADDRKSDWYEQVKTAMRMLEGERGHELFGLKPLASGLFEPGFIDPLDKLELTNEILRTVLKKLTWIETGTGGISRVNYADLDVEELGSVYERLLDFHPEIKKGEDGRWRFILKSDTGTDRKTSGSYYTRPELVRELIRSALIPVIQDRLATAGSDRISREKALLSIKVCDPSAGSGHMLLAAGRVLALELARVRTGEDNPAPSHYRSALREVIQHNLYGVDMNPAAVDLCKLALWLDGYNAGKPLSFLDHKIKVGNSLVGLTDLTILKNPLPSEAFDPVTGDDQALCKQLKKENRDFLKGQYSLFGSVEDKLKADQAKIAGEYRQLDAIRQENPGDIQALADRYKSWEIEPGRQKDLLAAHLYTAAFFQTIKAGAPGSVITSEVVIRFLEEGIGPTVALNTAKGLALAHRFFHWPLEFPDVFQDGGFDVMLGNPPWERIKLQEQEYFATRDPEIATAANKAARNRLIQTLPERNPSLYREFQEALHDAESASKFIRFGGRFTLTAVGDINTYSIFSELFTRQIRPIGRSGFIVPTGIATDDNNKQFFGFLVDQNRLASLFDFENREKLFAEVDSRYKFSLLTVAGGSLPAGYETRFAFFLTQPEQLSDDRRVFTLKKEDFLRLNPNTKTCPVFRTRRDAEITRKIYERFPVLINELTGENPWGIRFLRMFDMSNDSHLFRTRNEMEQAGYVLWGNQFIRRDDAGAITDRFLPLYEAKMIWHYDHRFGSYAGVSDRTSTQTPTPSLAQYQDPYYQILPWYWLDEKEVAERLVRRDKFNRIEWAWERKWLMGFRDITNSTNERTFITSVSIKGAFNHKFPLIFTKSQSAIEHIKLIYILSSIPFDFITRQKIGGTSMTFFYVKQFPFPSIDSKENFQQRFLLELIYTSWDIKPFADDVWNEADDELKAAIRQQWQENQQATGGHVWAPPEWSDDFGKTQAEVTGCPLPPFKWDEDRRARLRAELDALVARLYGLTDEELRYILDPQDVYGPAYPGETFRVLKEKEIRHYGEYRTKRLVLEAWERVKGEGN